MITYHLNFISPDLGRFEIEEPDGFNGIDFGIKQDDDRLGRDTSYAAGSNRLRFNPKPNHYFDKLMYVNDISGFEAKVQFEIDFDEDTEIIGNIDFSTATTDQNTYFECMVIEVSAKANVKLQKDTIVDLFSTTDIYGNYIGACPTYKLFLKAKPITNISLWNTPIPLNTTGAQILKSGLVEQITNLGTNPAFGNTRFDIQDTLSFVSTRTALSGGIPNIETFTYIEAEDNIKNIVIELSNIDLKVSSQRTGDDSLITDVNGYSRLVIRYGFDLASSTRVTLHSKAFDDDESPEYVFPTEFEYTIPQLNRGQRIWIYLENFLDAEVSEDSGNAQYIILNNFQNMDVRITGTSTAYSTLTPAVRLIDAIKQVIRSISGLNVYAPRWEIGGEYYNQFITTSNLMRNLADKPFYWSLKDIVDDYFPEPFADYQVLDNGLVIIDKYEGYYNNYEILNAEMPSDILGQIQGFESSYNPKYLLNLINIGFNTYESQKELTVENTIDEVHGEGQWSIPNTMVNNSKEVKIGVVRSAYSIARKQKEAYNLRENTATQDDSKIYILDCIDVEAPIATTETSFLKIELNDDGDLVLTNDLSFSWVILGITTTSPFQIMLTDGEITPNTGAYNVLNVTDNQLVLDKISGSPIGSDPANITYIYGVTTADIINRTNQDFIAIENIADGDNTANLKFTLRRVLENYRMYISTACSYTDNAVKNTMYKNNPIAITQLNTEDEALQESFSFIGRDYERKLTPRLFNVKLIMSLRQFFTLSTDLKIHNGYIRTFDGNGIPIKGYIKTGVYKIATKGNQTPEDFMGILEATLEEKYSPDDIYIRDLGNGTILINDEILPSEFSFSIDEYGKLSIFDGNGKLLYVPVYFNRVRVNDSSYAETSTQLGIWLQQIRAQG
jgi:hypothetical protein